MAIAVIYSNLSSLSLLFKVLEPISCQGTELGDGKYGINWSSFVGFGNPRVEPKYKNTQGVAAVWERNPSSDPVGSWLLSSLSQMWQPKPGRQGLKDNILQFEESYMWEWHRKTNTSWSYIYVETKVDSEAESRMVLARGWAGICVEEMEDVSQEVQS